VPEELSVGNGKIYANVVKSASSFTDGVYVINGITGEVKHLPAPNAYKGGWVESYDFYDKNADVAIFHTSFKPDMFTLATEVYYTENGGDTWDMIYDYTEHDLAHIAKVMISPDDPQKLFMARGAGPSGVNGGFYVSEDGGLTWTQSLHGYILSPIAVNPYNTNEIMVGTGMMTYPEALFRSFDGGYTWTEIPIEWKWHIMDNIWQIAYDPNDPNKIIVLEENQTIVTRDGFTTYEEFMVEPGDNYDVLVSVSINPYNGEEMFFSIDGRSAAFTSDSGENWEAVSGKPTSYRSESVSIGKAGVTDYAYYTRESKSYQRNIQTGEIVEIGADGCDIIIADASMGERYFLVNSDAERMFYSDASLTLREVPGSAANVKKIIRDPNNTSIYWAAMNGGISKIDITSLTNISVTPVNAPSTGDVTGIFVTGNSSEIYVAQGNKVYKTTNGGTSWSEKSSGLGTSTITDMAVNPLNNNEFMVAAGTQIYFSSNKAESWNMLLSGHSVDKLAFSPTTTGLLTAGVYSVDGAPAYALFSANNGTSWNVINGKALHNAHSQSMDFYFEEAGYADTYIASSDMGLCVTVRLTNALTWQL